MPMSSLPVAILSHMIAINNVPPPPLRNIPNLKMSKHINYGQLNALCHIRGLQRRWSIYDNLSAHNIFMKQYPKVFLHKKTRLPKLFKQEERRKPNKDKEESPCQQPGGSHNIADHVKKAHGGHTLYGPRKSMENLVEFLAILKKLPVHRTAYEHKTVVKMLKTIPELTSQLSDEHLKTLSKNVISETWVKGSTVVGNDGFYIILKGVAQPQIKVYENIFEGNDSTASFISQSFHNIIFNEDLKNSVLAEMNLPSHGSLREGAQRGGAHGEGGAYMITNLILLMIVESGNIISFVGYINSGYCNIYRNIIGFVKLQPNKVKKCQKFVYMGKLQERESFGEISVLLQVPFTCTVVTGKEVEMAIIEDKDLLENV
ncbi:PREDICTED: cyclic nucleotide-binding domain-containing protein 1 [Propithecus coquereli]|uniref:cyclic nucleotide-binding domain-containing protein 1 n=1 Tax=Propithecus coquereli TaxID=379532 RepID=UPI00063ED5C8|nr:PREDICTED: cyclic nucleotide-binding domain-containing protein 1 [Propithecus coquereli]